jgi:hypothetical protein
VRGPQFLQDGFFYRLPHRVQPAFAYAMQSLIAFVDRREPRQSLDHNALVFGLVAEKLGAET